MDIFIKMLRNFLQADEGVYVMENGSKIKMEKLIWRKGMVGFRVPGESLSCPGETKESTWFHRIKISLGPGSGIYTAFQQVGIIITVKREK